MGSFRMRFIVSKLSKEELLTLKRGEAIISKMLMIPDDYRIFHYKIGDEIEVETPEGYRIWTTIRSMEIIEDNHRVIVILTLVHVPSKKNQ
jgi:hypothetical protein